MKHSLLPDLVIVAVAASTLASASVFANDDSPPKVAAANSFAALDRNSDHRISRSEAGFDRKLSETFAQLDTDGDGFVSIAEFTAGDQNSVAIGKLTQQ